MKILIAYDGSDCAEAALDDLVRAGLPKSGEFLVMSVAEVWLPPESSPEWDAENSDTYLKEISRKHCAKNEKAVHEVEILANHAAQRLQKMFPRWTVSAEATYGSPAWEVLTKADNFKPDLIVAGSQGRSAVGRFFLGSISQKILTEAHSSVRVARGSIEVDPTTVRIVIGLDGSKGAQAAVDAVVSRDWPKESEVRLLAVSDPITPSFIGRFVPPIADLVEEVNVGESEWLHKLAEPALYKLTEAGLIATLSIVAGNPKQVLVEEAARWNADAIFVGANAAGSRLERFLLGSVSAAVAERSHCSVEVVRKYPEKPKAIVSAN